MKMESITSSTQITVISTEIIKPSKPTPSHLKTFKLSQLDQLIPNPYAPTIIFYPQNDDVSFLANLKNSLSKTLTRYYHLAGKIAADDLSVECNDQGARFLEAKVAGASLRQFLGGPNLISSLNELLPCQLSSEPSNEYVTNVQASVFDCGGLAIGLCISHKLLDGIALSSFLQSWSATCRGRDEDESSPIVTPCLHAASSLFPAEDTWLRDASVEMFGAMLKKGKCVTRRFVFDTSAISILKDEAKGKAEKYSPTRVEAVSAFLWKLICAGGEEDGKSSISTHLVNLRRRTTPFLAENSVGNLMWMVSAKSSASGEFASALRESFSKMDGDFVEKLKGKRFMEECFEELVKEIKFKDNNHVGFSSWCKFGLYEVDFGLGKPLWVSCVGMNGLEYFWKLVFLLDTRVGDGIEAWVNLDETHMAVVERNPELLRLARLDPNPFCS